MDWLTGVFATGLNWITNLFKSKTSSNVQGSGAGSGDIFSTIGDTVNQTATALGGWFEKFLPDTIEKAIDNALGGGGGETPFAQDIEYQGAVSSEIGTMKSYAERALSVLPPGTESVRDYIMTSFTKQADILASGQRNVADPSLFKGIMDDIYMKITGTDPQSGAAAVEGRLNIATTRLQGQGVNLVPTSTSLVEAGGTGNIQDALSSLIDIFRLPGGSGQSTTFLPGTPSAPSVIMTGGGGAGAAPASLGAGMLIPLILGGVLLFFIFKKGKVLK